MSVNGPSSVAEAQGTAKRPNIQAPCSRTVHFREASPSASSIYVAASYWTFILGTRKLRHPPFVTTPSVNNTVELSLQLGQAFGTGGELVSARSCLGAVSFFIICRVCEEVVFGMPQSQDYVSVVSVPPLAQCVHDHIERQCFRLEWQLGVVLTLTDESSCSRFNHVCTSSNHAAVAAHWCCVCGGRRTIGQISVPK